ncbi:alpha/beta hydrolase [Leifsonia sp. NPDC077715]|uniref:alpha/beta hydrolase n=1 Tax=Leifsonia sp. NPDC077715 TaxID=3155539 RepID=UPI00343D37F7
MPVPARRHPIIRGLALAATAIAVGSLVGVAGYHTSVEPGAAIVKAVFEARAEVTPPADFAAVAATVTNVGTVPVHADGVPEAHLQVFAPRTSGAPRPIVLWIHGGGFISSSADTVKDYAVMLAAQGYVVGNLDYSIAPGARYPVPIVQANAALGLLADRAAEWDADATRIFVGGDSAGAQIASQLGAVLTGPALARAVGIHPAVPALHVAGVVLFCGLYDMSTVASTGFPALRTYLWAYTGTRDWLRFGRIDELSTTKTATSAYPPTFITVGNADPFRTQAEELTERLRRLGVSVDTVFWTGSEAKLGHEYQFDFSTEQARTAFDATLAFLGRGSNG